MRSTLHAEIIPELLAMSSNTKRLKGFPICENLSAAECSDERFATSPLRITFRVNPSLKITDRREGKAFKVIGVDTVGMEVPIGKVGSVSCALSFRDGHPTLQVNRLFFRSGRVTIGNIHSIGWLLRDLCNIHLLNNGFALIHGAALRKDDRCILLIGLSNTGKTTTVKRMISEFDAETFGDDLFVTDGRRAIACPYTAVNVAPPDFTRMRDRIMQRARRSVPFYEYFGPTPDMSLVDHFGKRSISSPAPVDAILFLRKASASSFRKLDYDDAHGMLLASNCAEFKYATSSLLRAYDFLLDSAETSNAVRSEEVLLKALCRGAETNLVEGDIGDFISAANDALSPSEDSSPPIS